MAAGQFDVKVMQVDVGPSPGHDSLNASGAEGDIMSTVSTAPLL
jgi:hypothetical protein